MTTQPPSPTVGTEPPIVVVGADEQSDVEVDVDRWCRLAAATVQDAGLRGELTLTFVDRDEIAVLNEQHLGKPGPTDVLSFPIDEAGEPAGPRELGDVVICPEHTADLREAVIHGTLHLVGMDHETDDGEMLALQEQVLASLDVS